MSESTKPKGNLDELMSHLREEVAKRRAQNPSAAPQQPPASKPSDTVDWTRVHAGLNEAEHYVQVGNVVPGWERVGWLRRQLSQGTARLVLYFSSFITNQQRRFNAAILQLLRAISDGLRFLESRFVQRAEQLDGLEETVHQIRDRVAALEQAQQGEVQSLRRELAKWSERVNMVEGGLPLS